MSTHAVLKSFIAVAVICASLSLPHLSVAQEPVVAGSSFRSVNFPDRYIRHRLSFGYLDPVVARDKLARKDATFRLVPGLAGRCRSFESVNYPGHFLRHQNFRLQLTKRSEDDPFKQDATFCVVQGLADGHGRSFESLNMPGHFIRHSNFELWVHKRESTRVFRGDATFDIVRPLTSYAPSAPATIDPGTNQIPADE